MILERIQEQAQGLSKSERRVAECILAEPHDAIRLSIAKMAVRADVSQPTVNRFCRRVGCEGYPDLKLKLAQQLASSQQYKVREISDELTSEAIFNRMLESHLALAEDAHRRVSHWPVGRLVDWAVSSNRVIVLHGVSETDASERLVSALKRLGLRSSLNLPASREPFGASDVVIVLDLSGDSYSNTALEHYRVRGARLVVVGPSTLAVSRDADLVVPLVESPLRNESDFWISQGLLTLFVDSLIMAVGARRGSFNVDINSQINSTSA